MKKMGKMNLMFVLIMVFTLFTSISIVMAGETVDIVTFNDFHGNVAEDVNDWGKNLGMSKLVAKVNDMKANNPNTIVVSGGDNYQGTAISNLTYGAPVSDMMKALEVVVSAVGNHEFDWGRDYIAKWAKDGNFDYLASNIYDTSTSKPVEWAKPYKIINSAGIKIAFIGLAHPDTVTLTKVENVTGLEFRDPIIAAQEWIDYLKAGNAEEGIPDVIIAVTHLDSKQDSKTKEITGTAVTLAKGVTGLDAIVSAHSHRTVSGKVNGVAIVQAYKYGRALGLISIKVDDDGKVSEINESVNNVYKIKNDIIADSKTKSELAKYETELNPILNEIIGVAEGEMTHDRTKDNVSVLGQWACEVMAERAGTQIAIQNGGGLRRSLHAGNITMGDLYEVMPYDNQLVKMKLSGKDLRVAIDHGILNEEITDGSFSGVKVLFDRDAEFEKRILAITLDDGTPIKDDKYYTVVVNDFMYTGGDKYDFSNAKDVVDTYVPIRTVLIEKIKKDGKISPKKVDLIAEAQSYVVASGDVLGKIAKEHNVTVEEIIGFNNISNKNLIFVGEKLILPAE